MHIIKKPEAPTKRPPAIMEHKSVQQTLSMHRCTRFKNRRPYLPPTLQDRDQGIDLARPVLDATTASNNTTLRESIVSRPTPMPCCATQPRLAVVDKVDAHRSTSCLHHPAAAVKQCPHEGERR
jgi:hypothetical protein